MIEEVSKIADDMAALLPLFVTGGPTTPLFLQSEHSSSFKALFLDAKSILDEELGPDNDYSTSLCVAVDTGVGISGGPSYASVEQASKIVRVAARALERKRSRPSQLTANAKPFVDPARISELEAIGNKKWDFARLVELCREINVAASNHCHMSTAMILRSIVDHVPAVLGHRTFAEVANNYGGPNVEKSFKDSMRHLESSLRKIADRHLHSPITSSEVLPTAVQVDFSQALDVLLSEVIRKAR